MMDENEVRSIVRDELDRWVATRQAREDQRQAAHRDARQARLAPDDEDGEVTVLVKAMLR